MARRFLQDRGRAVALVVCDDRYTIRPLRDLRMGLQEVLPDRFHGARTGGHSDDLDADRALDVRGPAPCIRPRDETVRLQRGPARRGRALEEIVGLGPDL